MRREAHRPAPGYRVRRPRRPAPVLVSLDKYAKLKSLAWSGRQPLRLKRDTDKAFGVLVVSKGFRSQVTNDDLLAEVMKLRANLPEKETFLGEIEVKVVSLASIESDWGAHLAAKKAEADRRAAREQLQQDKRNERAATIARIVSPLPEGIEVTGAYQDRDFVQISHEHLLTILDQRTATSEAKAELLAQGWDAAVASLRYEDGTPVDVVTTVNPYRQAAHS